MKYKIVSTRGALRRPDAYIICIPSEPRPAASSVTAEVLRSLGIGLAEIKKTDGFGGLPSQEAFVRIVKGRSLRRVVLLGLGRRDAVTATSLRRRLERAGVLVRVRNIARPAVILPEGLPVEPELTIRAAVTGLQLGVTPPPTYAARRRSRRSRAELAQIVLPGCDVRSLSRLATRIAALGEIVTEARSWVSEPANAGSHTSSARSAPMAMASRRPASATRGPMDTTVMLPP